MRPRSIQYRSILIGTAAIILALATIPATAQMVVYDPSNYAQNVLQAARALQQINNQVTSLQNQTQMLLNQARNLTNLPYSALQAIDQSITRTQQLLNQAQRIAYDINQIDQAFSRSYPQSYSASTLFAAARRGRADALAELARRLPGRAAGPGRRGAGAGYLAGPDQWARLIEPVGGRHPPGEPGRQPADRPADTPAR